MGGSRVFRHVGPDMHQDNYKIRPNFYGELIHPAQFSPWLGKNLAARLRAWATLIAIRSVIMPAFSPALITIMRSVLEDAMAKVPAEQATTVTKAYLAEFILKAAAGGLTSYEGLITAAVAQLPTIISTFV